MREEQETNGSPGIDGRRFIGGFPNVYGTCGEYVGNP